MFQINCIECNRNISTDSAKSIREHAKSVYSFVCLSCWNDARAQENPTY